MKQTISDRDKTAVASAVRRAKLIDASRKLARMHRTQHPTAEQLHRRTMLETDLGDWLKYYMHDSFPDDWGTEHNKCLTNLQRIIEQGGSMALAMPRASGKSTIGKGAVVYAALSGKCKYIVPIGATDSLASEYMDFTKGALTGDYPRLQEDYPDALGFFDNLGGSALRARHQLCEDGKPSGIGWRTKGVTFPTVRKPDSDEGYPYSGARIECRGITAAMRGMAKNVRGTQIRPDLVIPDDIQTEEVAESPEAINKIERKVVGTIMMLAGHKKRIACFMPCTCMRRGDVSDRFLDRELHPEFQGQRVAMVQKWPDAQETLWVRYHAVRRGGETDHEGKAAATEFYAANRAEMDKGAVVSWASRIRSGELSAIETAENLLFELGPARFAAEMQNQPLAENESVHKLEPKLILLHIDEKRGVYEIPPWAQIKTMGTDINHYGLHTVATGFGNDHTAAIYFRGRYDKIVVKEHSNESEIKRMVFEMLSGHLADILKMPVKPDVWGIDGGYQHDVVQGFVTQHNQRHGIAIYVMRGYSGDRYRSSGSYVIGRPREQVHFHKWPLGKGLAFNADYWCEVTQKAWQGAIGIPGGVTLYHGQHDDFAEQVCSKILTDKFTGKDGQPFWRYTTKPGWHDYADALTMAYAAAAFAGIGTAGHVAPKPKPKRRVCKVPLTDA